MAAECREAGDDMVAGRTGAHFAANLLDDAGRLVTEHYGHLGRIGTFNEVQVGVTDTSRSGSDQYLIGAGLADLDVFDAERFSDFTQDCRFHGVILFGYRESRA
jgi:hypothetical protein